MKRIYAQIEELANLYSPSVYALLPQFRDYQMEYDPASTEFKPLTAGRAPDVKNSKIFVVGILPPSVKVTGRLLDRSAQLGGDAGDAAAIASAISAAPESAVSTTPTTPGAGDCPAIMAEAQMAQNQTREQVLGFLAGPGDYTNGTLNGRSEAQYMGDPVFAPHVTNCMMTMKALWRQCGITDPRFDNAFTGPVENGQAAPNAGPWITLAQESGAWVDGTSSEMPKRGDVVQSVIAGAARTALIALGQNPNRQHAFCITGVGSGTTTTAEGGVPAMGLKAGTQTWVKGDGGYWYVTSSWGGTYRKVLGWAQIDKIPTDGGAVEPDVEPSTDFQEEGSDAAKDAAKEQKASAGKEERGAPTAEDYLREQRRMVNATRAALDRINATPPLKLLVNPISFKPSSEKIVSDGNRSRSHHIIEHWGEQQEKIEGSGKLLGFYSQSQSGPGPGLTRTARQYSLSYQNLMSLFLIYKNNGGVWLEDFFESRSDKGAINLSVMGSIYIYYDNILYIGCFDSFNISESDAAPYTLEYNFSFTVRASFLLDRQLENSAQSYGAPGLFVGDLQTGTPDAPAGSPVQKQYTEAEMFSQHDDVVADWESEDRAEANKKKADEMFESPAPSGGNNAITPGKGSKTQSTGR